MNSICICVGGCLCVFVFMICYEGKAGGAGGTSDSASSQREIAALLAMLQVVLVQQTATTGNSI